VKIVKPSVELVTFTPEPERLIERMGRICYQSSHKVKVCGKCEGSRENFNYISGMFERCYVCNGTGTDIESAITFVNMIKTNQHESVLEHPSASFMVVCDRGVTHEKVRHRIASFSQESTRYCNYMKEIFGNEISVIQPPFAFPEKSTEDFVEACEFAEKKYLKLLANGESPQIARSVLPTCLKAQIGMSANFREWRHFLKLRTSPKAHPQMREIAEMIRRELLKISNVCFNDIE
jgi:thymidylate synthase (FAD)